MRQFNTFLLELFISFRHQKRIIEQICPGMDADHENVDADVDADADNESADADAACTGRGCSLKVLAHHLSATLVLDLHFPFHNLWLRCHFFNIYLSKINKIDL